MKEQRISELITKYFANTATEQECKELMQWYQSVDHGLMHWPEEEAVFEQRIAVIFSRVKQSIDQQVDQQSVDLKTDETTDRPEVSLKTDRPTISQQPRSISYKWVSVAALLVVVLGAVLSLSLLLFLNSPEQEALIAETIKPGSNKAVLTLASGQTIVLDNETTGTAFVVENDGTFTTDYGELLYRAEENNQEVASLSNVLTTPKGGQYTMQLSDGTKVFLNVESTLSFPTAFTGKERRVTLGGEGYFEVAKSKERPFIIETADMEIEVLGTAFNVRNYPDEICISTSLVEGSVRVRAKEKELMLTPGEGAILNKADGSLHTVKVDLATETAWINGYFMFNDQHIESIMKQLSRWYDVEVVYQGDMKNMMFSGKILRRSEITEVLDMLQLTGTIHFEIEGRRVIVMP